MPLAFDQNCLNIRPIRIRLSDQRLKVFGSTRRKSFFNNVGSNVERLIGFAGCPTQGLNSYSELNCELKMPPTRHQYMAGPNQTQDHYGVVGQCRYCEIVHRELSVYISLSDEITANNKDKGFFSVRYRKSNTLPLRN